MSEVEAGEEFLGHRGAVLDALLSNPVFADPVPADFTGSQATGAMGETGLPMAAGSLANSMGQTRASEHIHAILGGSVATGETLEEISRLSAATIERSESESGSPAPVPEIAPSPARRTRFTRFTDRIARMRIPLVGYARPRTLAIVGGALLSVLLLVFVTTRDGGGHSTSSQVIVTSAAPPTRPPNSTATAAASAVIQVRSAETECPAGSTPGMDAFSGDAAKAWSCVRAYQVDGQIMIIDLGRSYAVDSIGIVPGWDHVGPDGVDQWSKHRTVNRVSYQFDDDRRTTFTQETKDQRAVVVTKIDPAVTASHIVLTVLRSTGDRSINDVAISSVVITGK